MWCHPLPRSCYTGIPLPTSYLPGPPPPPPPHWTLLNSVNALWLAVEQLPPPTSIRMCWYQPSLGSWLSHRSPSPPWHEYLMSVCLFPSPLHIQNEPQPSACVFCSFKRPLKRTARKKKKKAHPPLTVVKRHNVTRRSRQPINKWSGPSSPCSTSAPTSLHHHHHNFHRRHHHHHHSAELWTCGP